MSGIIDTTLPQLANQVRTATVANENDRERVGSLFEGIIDYIAQNEAAWLQDTGGGGGGSLSEPGALLKKLWLKGNPEAERILKYDGSDWVPIPVPSGGGSGGGMDVAAMWAALQSTTGDYANTKIPANHLDLTSCLKTNTTFWGNTANTTSNPNAVTGSLSGGIQFVEFSNNVKIGIDPNNPDTIRIYKDNNDSAHFYATGGVSALGYSSSGGGGGGGDTPLNDILASINGSNNTVPTFDSALKYAVLRTNQGWQVLENTLGRLSNVHLNNNLADGQALVYNSNGYWENRTVSSGGGTLSINGLDEVVNSFNSLSGGQVLTYSTSLGKWTNADLPAATSAISGIMKIGNDTVQTIAANTPTATTGRTYSIQLNSKGQAVVNVPWVDTNTTYSAGNGLTGTSTFSVLRDGDNNSGLSVSRNGVKVLLKNSNPGLELNGGLGVKATGGLTVGSDGVKIDPNTNKRVLWGNDDKLTNNIGSDITFDYGRGIQAYTTSNNTNAVTLLRLSHNSDSTHEFDLGYGSTVSYGVTTQIYGVDVDFFTADVDSNGNVVKNAQNNTVVSHTASFLRGGGLAIGNGVLKWDSVNNALYVQKIDGTAANFYATGGVSALGMSSGSGSVPAMTFGSLAVNNELTIGNNSIVIDNEGWLSMTVDEGIYIDNSVKILASLEAVSLKVGSNGNNISKISWSEGDHALEVKIGGTTYQFIADNSY